MKERKIAVADVKAVIASPDRQVFVDRNRILVNKNLKEKVLEVV